MNSKSNNYVGIVMMAAGFLLIVLSWNGAASFDTVQQQFPYLLSGGVGGLGLVAGGLTLLVIQENRRSTAALENKLDQVIAALSSEDNDGGTTVGNGNLTDRQRRALERAAAN